MQSWFLTHRKKLEEVNFVDEEFLHKKINKNGKYVDYGVLRKIVQKMHVIRQPESNIMEI